MYLKSLSIIFLLFLISCKKELKTLSYSERYEKETYELINNALVSQVEKKEKYNIKYNKSDRQILEKPYSFYPHDKEIFNNIIPEEYLSKMDTLLKIKKWKVDKLKRFNLIHEKVPKDLHEIYLKDSYKKYRETCRKVIGESYVLLSNPIFIDNFNKAFIYTRTDGTGGDCLTSQGFYLYSKESGSWKLTRDLMIRDEN